MNNGELASAILGSATPDEVAEVMEYADTLVSLFAGFTGISDEEAEQLLEICTRLAFLRWAFERMINGDLPSRLDQHEFTRRKKQLWRMKFEIEKGLGNLVELTKQPYPEWLTPYLVAWTNEEV
ncbi:MAG: hypothetical protein L0332_30400 [Chloroflexi bacterium]|nr:hypothetical protein [Chloroflexota bacterium]